MSLEDSFLTIENLGEYLRGKRLSNKVTLEDLATRTRISIRFLEAIEENRFDHFPNTVSARGFLRAYARELNLDEEAILLRYLQLVKQPQQTDSQVGPASPVIRASLEGQSVSIGSVMKMVIPIALFGTVLLFVWIIGQESGNGGPVREKGLPPPFPIVTPPSPLVSSPSKPPVILESSEPKPVPSALAETPVEPPRETVSETSVPVQAPGPPPLTSPTEERLVLEIEALELAWLEVVIDDTPTREALLRPGESVRWEADSRFLLTIGNAGGVEVRYNGEPLEPFGPKGQVARGILLAR